MGSSLFYPFKNSWDCSHNFSTLICSVVISFLLSVFYHIDIKNETKIANELVLQRFLNETGMYCTWILLPLSNWTVETKSKTLITIKWNTHFLPIHCPDCTYISRFSFMEKGYQYENFHHDPFIRWAFRFYPNSSSLGW